MKRIFLAGLLTMASAFACFADIARPERPSGRVEKPPTSLISHMMIKLEPTATEAKLIIPRSQLKQLRAELDSIDDSGNSAVAGFQRTQMIVSGTLISLAFVFAGLWFVRSGRNMDKTGKVAGILTVAAFSGGMATLVFANAGPPAEARTITGKMFSEAVHQYKFGSGKVRLELSDADHIVMIVPDPKPSATPAE